MELIGKTTINPILFYSGKISGYISWIIFLFIPFSVHLFNFNKFLFNQYFSIIVLLIGLVFTTISFFNLGKSTRLGLPSNETKLKTNGLYKISRNPMYVGFNLITISVMIYTLHWVIIIMGIYSLIVYHKIIRGEEKFMKQRFGDAYMKYKQKVRRYL